MLQTLFHIPRTVAGLPVFGFGWLLMLWAIGSLALLGWLVRRQGWNAETKSHLPLLGTIGLVIAFVLPNVCDEYGLPIRGYGTMLLLGVISGVWLATYRARRLGLDPEIIISLAFWLFLAGIVGARLFYIIEYWSDYQRPTAWETFKEVINFTKGGLVVFGSAIGAGLALIVFVRKYRLPGLALADLIAPSLMLGQALGRVGCFLNGCCYGGVCDLPWKVQFPFDSPPYVEQVREHRLYLHGLELDYSHPDSPPVIAAVEPDSPAAEAGLEPGQRIVKIKNLRKGTSVAPPTTDEAFRALLKIDGAGARFDVVTAGDPAPKRVTLATPELSLPVHPAQLYSAVDALLLCLFLLAYYPYRRRDGEVFALLATIHPIARFLQEIIRVDEKAVFHTELSISQNLSLLMLAGAIGLWIYLLSRPRGLVWPRPAAPACQALAA
ncbi:MAG TPA: prolipoprotein diacylglyceryl transferase family protein [Pirellulales bacterium]|nr:prolipoprotein diacylglyceryl transferase family protein [Pirellulales bacterium]